ncbi:solute carrier family 13 (sodium-dependent dicarboxylate transporter), member 2/3/5 [Desulfosarcina sp. BuS5]|uniref:SLC13 family permease n=1 Tax=Desulfosarcina sp. BuS5 TaxID=933262 RepID=UPI00068586FD|nr:SLC13 family permease [Desulfosarcina sp. BuS5]WDN90316.1 solute carrier family 13 (sodium-dependent dicarboxylate transporter), member 2/3/5 [Desulfosarcina sp. BuS5]
MAHNTFTDDSYNNGWTWKNRPGYKPILFTVAAILFVAIVFAPPPQGMIDMVSKINPSGYKLEKGCATITDTVNKKLRPESFKETKNQVKQGESASSNKKKPLLSNREVAQMAKVMVAILFLAAFLWGTEALPLGATDIMVGVMLYLFVILPINEISKAYMKDAVFFIFGILAVAVGVAKTGLDKRIGLILLSRIKSAKGFSFLFLPMLAIAASFLSEHALVALLIPVLMGVYKVTCKMYGVKKDRSLAVFLLLGVCFAANHGGPGSPAAGGRNAIMVGYFMEYGASISFLEWMKYGLPFVPLMAVVIGAYMYIRCKPKFMVKDVNPGEVVKAEVENMPKFGGKEAAMAVILVLLIAAWILIGEHAGLGGPTLYAVMAMFVCRIVEWEDLQQGVAFDVVGLYAAACAMGVGLKFTGGALWLANTFVSLLPDFMSHGDGLVVGVSLLTGTMTNFMSDGATVAALGPIVLPMATLAGVSVWKVGLACAYSSSFANFLVVGTPNNAIAFGMGRDPETGERLLDVLDFVKFGLPVTILAWLVLWFWAIFGYWQFLSWS